MANILIKPVQTRTSKGLSAEITGIDPSDTDCLVGTVQEPSGTREHNWNDSGICRGGIPDLNLDPNDIVIKEVIDIVNSIK